MTARTAIELLRTDAQKLLELLNGSVRSDVISEANLAAVESLILDASSRFAHLRASWLASNPDSALANSVSFSRWLGAAVEINRKSNGLSQVVVEVTGEDAESDDAAVLTQVIAQLSDALDTLRRSNGSSDISKEAVPDTPPAGPIPATAINQITEAELEV